MMEASNNGSSLMNQSSICLKMRELIEAMNEYAINKNDSSAVVINKFLQAYSVTVDVNAFDPENGLGAQFYVSLYNLFASLEPQSQMAWNCVDVLCNACRNSSARQSLIDTYQFVPTLSKMLSDQLSTHKKKKLLMLLQDLTCGIKLTWQVSHLPHLLRILTKWVEDQDQDIVCLSLSVLVNLCFNNVSVVNTLARIVDMKKFLRFCLPLQGPLVEIHTCKLMIILNHPFDSIPKNTLLHLVAPTFKSMQESLSKNDTVMLRSVVNFFVEMINSENKDVFKEYEHYDEQVHHLIKSIHFVKLPADSDSTPVPQTEPECVVLVLKFIYELESNKITNFSRSYANILNLALEWVHLEKVSFQANVLLMTITQNLTDANDKNNLNLLRSNLPEFLTMLQKESTPANMDDCRRLGSLLQLLRMMLKANHISHDVLKSLSESLIMNIFSPILSEDFNLKNLPMIKVNEETTTSTEYVDAYVSGIGLVYELVQYDAGWLDTLNILVENRNMQQIIAVALSGSKSKMKKIVLELFRYSRFPIDKIACAMEVSHTFYYNKKPLVNVTHSLISHNSTYPVLSCNQLEMVDDTLKHFRKIIQEQNIANISVREVMELYEYKLTSLSNSELSVSNNLQAATERCVHLQHRLAQLSSERNKLGQLIHNYESRLDKSDKSMNDLKTFYLEERKNADHEIEKWQIFLKEKEDKLSEVKESLLQMTKQKDNVEEQLKKYQVVIQRLEESGNKFEKQLQTREQQLKNANSHIDNLNVQVKDLRKMLDQKEAKLADVTKHYLATKEVLNTITKVATSQMNSERHEL